MIIEVKSHILAAVQAACAGKNDPRRYLRGWHLDTSDPGQAWIVGTNGHVMVAAPVDTIDAAGKPAKGLGIFFPITVTKTAEPHDILINTTRAAALARDKERPLVPVEEATYPGWKKLLEGIENKVGNGNPQPFIGIDAQVLAPIAAALSVGRNSKSGTKKRATCRVMFGPNRNDGMIVRWGGSIDAAALRCVWMPCIL